MPIPLYSTSLTAISICEDVNLPFKFLFFLKVGIFAEKQKNNIMRDQGSSASFYTATATAKSAPLNTTSSLHSYTSKHGSLNLLQALKKTNLQITSKCVARQLRFDKECFYIHFD